jgi:hypothetical protein
VINNCWPRSQHGLEIVGQILNREPHWFGFIRTLDDGQGRIETDRFRIAVIGGALLTRAGESWEETCPS